MLLAAIENAPLGHAATHRQQMTPKRPLPKEGPHPKTLVGLGCRRRDSNPRHADYDDVGHSTQLGPTWPQSWTLAPVSEQASASITPGIEPVRAEVPWFVPSPPVWCLPPNSQFLAMTTASSVRRVRAANHRRRHRWRAGKRIGDPLSYTLNSFFYMLLHRSQ